MGDNGVHDPSAKPGGVLGGLAGRIRRTIEEEEERRRREVEEKEREARARREAEERLAQQKVEAQAARRALLEEIAQFGQAVGRLEVAREGEAVVLAYGPHRVRFEPEGDRERIALVVVDAAPRHHFLDRDVDGTWECVLDEGHTLRHLPIDEGLEEVLRAFLIVPGVEAAAPPAAAEPAPAEPAPEKERPPSPGSELRELKSPLE